MTTTLEKETICKACHQTSGDGKFCKNCSQAVNLKRITVGSIAHEAFHFFTHVDKGFLFTLKKLLREPGKMQREYLQGVRVKHQKPLSMFLICATIVALTLYWLNFVLVRYFDAGDLKEGLFFDKYMVLLLAMMVPLFSLLTFAAFYNSKYNYAEIVVFSLYTISFFFIVVAVINLSKLVVPEFQTRFAEFPIVLVYNAITFRNFFREDRPWVVILKKPCLCPDILYCDCWTTRLFHCKLVTRTSPRSVVLENISQQTPLCLLSEIANSS
jgi:hypothetical protein